MFIVRKKYVIKIVAFALLFIVVIAGIFISESHQKTMAKKQNDRENISLLTNICASVQSINNSFEKSINLGSFENKNNEIYAMSYTVKNMIYYAAPEMKNTSKWFSLLCEYSKTDMTDSEKNTFFHSKLTQAVNLMLNICSDFKSNESIAQIENLFIIEENKDFYKNALETLEEQYPLLTNQIVADRKDITDFAKKLLNFPLSPKQFYGNYKAPKAISYSHSASYAEIFASGNMLNRMAVQNTQQNTAVSDLMIHDAAKHYLTIYAPYAENCQQIFSQKTNKTMYFVFCPEITYNNAIIINYNEQIKLALNIADNSLKAFDASEYLKNHNTPLKKRTNFHTPAEVPTIIKPYTIISQKNALFNQSLYIEYCFTTDGLIKYYLIRHNDNSTEIYSEQEYFSFLNIK